MRLFAENVAVKFTSAKKALHSINNAQVAKKLLPLVRYLMFGHLSNILSQPSERSA
jgi:hypothetical protein